MQLLRRLWIFYIFLLASFSALAGEARIGVPSYALKDPFVQSLQNAIPLKESGIETKFIAYDDPAKLLESVLTGSSNLALVSLESISKHKFDNPPDLVPIFTRPFIFEKTQEAFAVQETPLGAAVLSDLNRTGLVALGFWNQGTSQLISSEPLCPQ